MKTGSIPVESRVQKRRQDAAARVLEAATTLFARGGFAETSMASIASEADVSVGTLYNLFDSKEDLYRELVRSKAATFRKRLVAAIDVPGTATERLERFLDEQGKLFTEEAHTIRLYYQINSDARMSLRASFSEEPRAMYDEAIERLAALLREGAERGEFDLVATPYRSALYCQAIVNELFFLHASDPVAHPAGAVCEELRRIIHRAVVAVAPAPAGQSKETHK